MNIVFLLIIKNADDEWMIPIRDDLSKRMRAEMNIWESRHFWLLTKLKLEKRAG